jgi:hypothetical protein
MVMATLFIAGCGTSKAEEEHKKEVSVKAAEARTKAAEARAQEVEAQKVKAEGQTCKGQVDALIKAEAHLSGRLNVGLSFDEYSSELSNVSVAYQETPFKTMNLTCLKAATGAEDALNAFQRAHKIWQTCLKETECSNESIKPKLQAEWAKAEKGFEHAKGGLEELSQGTVPGSGEPASASP